MLARVAEVLSDSTFVKEPIHFGDNAILYGLQTEAVSEGLRVTTVWRGGMQTERLRFLHICDGNDAILRHARQLTSSRKIRPNRSVWVDEIVIPYRDLLGASKLGIGFHSKTDGLAKVSAGPRSLSDCRLDIALPHAVEQMVAKIPTNDTVK